MTYLGGIASIYFLIHILCVERMPCRYVTVYTLRLWFTAQSNPRIIVVIDLCTR